MKRLILLFCFLCGMAAFGVQAQDVSTIYGLVSENNSAVRSGPDFAYSTIGELPLNASVVVVGRSGDFFRTWDGRQWLQIEYGDRRAWIYARLVRTSIAFNSIPPTGRLLPRDANQRVPEEFDLGNGDICANWGGEYALTGNFMAGDTELTVTYPGLQGANMYTVIAVSPSGFLTPFDSDTTTVQIKLNRLPWEEGVYTWRVAPYWTNSTQRYLRQQVCLLHTAGTFEKPNTKPPDPDAESE